MIHPGQRSTGLGYCVPTEAFATETPSSQILENTSLSDELQKWEVARKMPRHHPADDPFSSNSNPEFPGVFFYLRNIFCATCV
jgi:hypothetical protein